MTPLAVQLLVVLTILYFVLFKTKLVHMDILLIRKEQKLSLVIVYSCVELCKHVNN